MKVKDVSEEKKEFEPIKLELTFETEEEAVEFWHRMNADASFFTGYCLALHNIYNKTSGSIKGIQDGCLMTNSGIYELFHYIDNILDKRKLL